MEILQQRIKEFVQKPGFVTKVEAFKKANKYNKKGGIVFLGDSITQAFNVYEYFNDYLVYNRGIGGDDSVGVFTRLDESVYDLKPSKLFLLLGTNDLTHFKEDTGTQIGLRLKYLIETIQKNCPETEIFVQSVYPVNMDTPKRTCEFRSNEMIDDINNVLKAVESITYIDMHPVLAVDGLLNEGYTLDGLHFNDEGYEVVRNELIKYL